MTQYDFCWEYAGLSIVSTHVVIFHNASTHLRARRYETTVLKLDEGARHKAENAQVTYLQNERANGISPVIPDSLPSVCAN